MNSKETEYQKRRAYILILRKEAEWTLNCNFLITNLSTDGLSCYKLVKDLVEKISKNSSSSTRLYFTYFFFLLDALTV